MGVSAVLKGEGGAALITALMLTSLCLVISMVLMYSIIQGTKVSASHQRYKNVLAATHGGVEEVTQEIIPYLLANGADKLQQDFSNVSLAIGSADNGACLKQKVNLPTGDWGKNNVCKSGDQLNNPDPSVSPDLTFALKGAGSDPGFTIYTKILDTVPGNSDRFGVEGLEQGGSVSANEEGIRPQHVPALFNIAVSGERSADPAGTVKGREKARLSVLYAY